jgi:gliding motility-associated-like protein
VDSVTITFTEPLVATVTTTDAICFEACDGTASVAVTGGNGAFTYTWSNGIAGDTLAALDICAGDYSIAVADTNGCATAMDLTIGQPVLLEIDATSYVEPWCFGGCDGSVTITDAEAVEYSFNGGASWTTSATLVDACSQGYQLMIRNADGCEGSLLFLLPEPPQVIAEFAHGPIPANVNAPTITFVNQSQHSIAWEWDIAGLLATTAQSPVYTFSNKEPGIYEVCLVARDAHQCADTICHTVIIDDVLFTYVPNAFTPDGDGVNEVWAMTSNIPDIKAFELRVFDRWGEVVFESIDPYKGWDGSYRNGGGERLKQDLYVYKIVYQIASTGGVREHIGHVSLLK